MNLYAISKMLSEKHDIDYYITMADKEILLVPLLIEILSSEDYNQRMRACTILETISICKPKRISPFADFLIKSFDNFDDFAQWRAMKIIANIIEYIPQYAEDIAELFIKAFSSCNIGKFSIACDCVLMVADSYPSIVELFKMSIADIENRDFSVGSLASKESKFIANEKIKSVLSVLDERYKN